MNDSAASVLRVEVSIGSAPQVYGLRYWGLCPHGKTSLKFTADDVWALSGSEKVRRLAAQHRQTTGCVCQAEDEQP